MAVEAGGFFDDFNAAGEAVRVGLREGKGGCVRNCLCAEIHR